MLYGVYGSFISAGAVEGGVAHAYLINDNNIDKVLYDCVYYTIVYSRPSPKKKSDFFWGGWGTTSLDKAAYFLEN